MSSKRGRPKGPEKVVFKKRVTPEMAAFLEKQFKGLTYGGPEPSGWVNTGFTPENIKAMEKFGDAQWKKYYAYWANAPTVSKEGDVKWEKVPDGPHVPTFAGPAFAPAPQAEEVVALQVQVKALLLGAEVDAKLIEGYKHKIELLEQEVREAQEMGVDEKGRKAWQMYYALRDQMIQKAKEREWDQT